MTDTSQELPASTGTHRFNRYGPIEEPDEDVEPFDIEAVIRKYQSRTPEQIEDVRRRLYALTQEPRPLPPGKTLNDVIEGSWPGHETDEEIFRALEDLS